MINLPHDGNSSFNLALVIRKLITTGKPYIIQGQQQVSFENHTKPNSLDYFIRSEIAKSKDTAQATNDVINQICATGLFKINNALVCPDSGKKCKGIELKNG